ncbi:MAG: hypothetical protein ABJB76_11700 [Candidatus Nitrosocosmicus sp.]
MTLYTFGYDGGGDGGFAIKPTARSLILGGKSIECNMPVTKGLLQI